MIPPVTREKTYDVVGLGLNAVDYLCVVPYFPRFNSKLKMVEFQKQGGGQVATALVALSRWGMRTSYIGKVGDDDLGHFTRQELLKEGLDLSHVMVAEGALSQFAFILVDRQTGERTIVWHREDGLWPCLLRDFIIALASRSRPWIQQARGTSFTPVSSMECSRAGALRRG